MTWGATIVSAWISTPPAVLSTIILAWYWTRLGDDDVAESRRRIRRFSLFVASCVLPLLVYGLSWIDSTQSPRAFVVTWMLLLGMAILFGITALIDVGVSVRLGLRHRQAMAEIALRELAKLDDDHADAEG